MGCFPTTTASEQHRQQRQHLPTTVAGGGTPDQVVGGAMIREQLHHNSAASLPELYLTEDSSSVFRSRSGQRSRRRVRLTTNLTDYHDEQEMQQIHEDDENNIRNNEDAPPRKNSGLHNFSENAAAGNLLPMEEDIKDNFQDLNNNDEKDFSQDVNNQRRSESLIRRVPSKTDLHNHDCFLETTRNGLVSAGQGNNNLVSEPTEICSGPEGAETTLVKENFDNGEATTTSTSESFKKCRHDGHFEEEEFLSIRKKSSFTYSDVVTTPCIRKNSTMLRAHSRLSFTEDALQQKNNLVQRTRVQQTVTFFSLIRQNRNSMLTKEFCL